jgi:ATP-dependent RNA/DNA helicase IGHMBP2
MMMMNDREQRGGGGGGSHLRSMDEVIREFVSLQRVLLAAELACENGLEEEQQTQQHHEGPAVPASTVVLRNLALLQVSVGLYGRTVVTLGFDTNESGKCLLPQHRFTTGDEVQILSKSSKLSSSVTAAAYGYNHREGTQGQGGVVSQVDETFISIALFGKNHNAQSATTAKEKDGKANTNAFTSAAEDETTILGSPPFSIVPKSSAEVHNKMMQALADLERHGASHPIYGNVVQAIFSGQQKCALGTTTATETRPTITTTPYNPNLDDSQLQAIAFSLHPDRHVSLIHGPPGTGKTSTVAELIQQAVHHHKYKVLVAAPSNVAVDNVLERIVQSQQMNRNSSKKTPASRIRAVRIGHPARIKPGILQYSLEAQVQNSEGTEIVQTVRQELQSYLQILLRPKSSSSRGTDDKRTAYREVKLLRQEVRQRETKVVQSLLQDAQVILCTTVGAANRILKDMEFDLVIIDEAAQALEASCWIPIQKGKRLILAGDHCQLPPTIKSHDPKIQKGLSITLFERILNVYARNADQVSRMLQVQYRMHQSIADWASGAMYHGQLQTHESVAHHVLSDLIGAHRHFRNGGDDFVDDDDDDDDDDDCSGEDHDQPALLLIDTAGCGMEEGETSAGSRFNQGEAQLVVQHVQTLLRAGLKPEEIAVISPYNGQVELLRTLLLPEIAPKLEIRSVDGFQGGEREAVVLSLVRCNHKGVIGFLGDSRRLNVAITRAKRHCAVICDTETVTKSKFIGGLIDWMEQHGEYRSAAEFHQSDMQGDLELAELELGKLIGDSNPERDPTTGKKPTNREHFAKKEQERLTSLLDQVTEFARKGHPGETKIMGNHLSKNERRLVHERATELGIEHRSEGVEGVNRHIILKIPGGEAPAPEVLEDDIEHESEELTLDMQEDVRNENEVATIVKPSAFQVLGSDDDDDDDDDDVDHDNDDAGEQSKPVMDHDVPPTMNSLLASLALERRQRQQGAMAPARPPVGQPQTGGKARNKKKGGQKLGGTSISAKPSNDLSSDLDDMAFLDSQIDKVQNSHGRKVEGTGGYRTIINGILIAKPAPPSTKKDAKKSAALNAKLQAAQEDRKAKGGKKKKK